MRRAALEGLGIAILPEFAVRSDIKNGSLRPVLEGWRVDPTDIYAVYASRHHLPLSTRRLIDFLADRFEGWLSG